MPEQQSTAAGLAGEGREEEGPDLLVPFPLLSGIALAGTRHEGQARGHLNVGELREAMRELHSKASKLAQPNLHSIHVYYMII